MNNLKPCPFCGKTNVKMYSAKDPSLHGFIHICEVDGDGMVKIESRLFHTEEQAIDAWNRRQPDLITQIQNGIKATDADDAYSCGMRNGMRWCISLIDDKEPLYENCPPEQSEIVRCKDCKFYSPMNRETKTGICNLTMHQNFGDNWFCAGAERREEES